MIYFNGECVFVIVSTKRALRIGKIDPVDYYGYWKLFDALRDCSLEKNYCEMALGGKEEMSYLGNWDDNHTVRPLTILTEIDQLP